MLYLVSSSDAFGTIHNSIKQIFVQLEYGWSNKTSFCLSLIFNPNVIRDLHNLTFMKCTAT